MSWEIGTSFVRRNLESVNKERIPVSQHNVNDLIDVRSVYFNLGAFNRKAFTFIFCCCNSYKTNIRRFYGQRNIQSINTSTEYGSFKSQLTLYKMPQLDHLRYLNIPQHWLYFRGGGLPPLKLDKDMFCCRIPQPVSD